MKKLMIMLGIAAIAVCSQAGYVAWNLTSVTGPDGAALGTGSAYVFFVESTTKYDTSGIAATLAGKGASDVQTAMNGAGFNYKFSDLTSTAGTWSYNATTAGAAINQTTLGLSQGTKYSVYAVIFDTETITDASKFYVTTASSAAQTYDNSAGTTRTFAIGAQTASATASNWSSVAGVPEPTSGILMLVGLGALALRRRKA